MRRRILIGLLLGMAAICFALGVGSYWQWGYLHCRVNKDWTVGASVVSGSFNLFQLKELTPSRPRIALSFARSHRFLRGELTYGFTWQWDRDEIIIGVPFWTIDPILIILAWRIWRRGKIPPGMCAHCGYDLRATPEGGEKLLEICPECGRREMPEDEG